MSGQSGGSQNQEAQAGQPQGQSNQRQPPQGNAPPAGGGDGGNDALQEWAVFSAILFAISGVGMGLLAFLMDAVDEPLYELDIEGAFGEGFSQQLQFEEATEGLGAAHALGGFEILPFLAVFIAPFVGVLIATQVTLDDGATFQAAGASLAAGTLVLSILGWFVMSLTFPDGLSLDFGGVIINAVVAAIIAAIVAVGGVWAQRNQYPEA